MTDEEFVDDIAEEARKILCIIADKGKEYESRKLQFMSAVAALVASRMAAGLIITKYITVNDQRFIAGYLDHIAQLIYREVEHKEAEDLMKSVGLSNDKG